jgi:hypothetical protein
MKYFSPILLFILTSCFSTFPSTSTNTNTSNNINEAAEFAALMNKDKIGKDQRIAESLNILLNNDPKITKAVITFINNTNCDLILKIYGSTDYILPVAKNGKNFVILERGYYNIKYNVCNSPNFEHINVTDSKELSINTK